MLAYWGFASYLCQLNEHSRNSSIISENTEYYFFLEIVRHSLNTLNTLMLRHWTEPLPDMIYHLAGDAFFNAATRGTASEQIWIPLIKSKVIQPSFQVPWPCIHLSEFDERTLSAYHDDQFYLLPTILRDIYAGPYLLFHI